MQDRFPLCVLFRPVVSAGSSPGVQLVTREASDKSGLTGLEVCHLYQVLVTIAVLSTSSKILLLF